MADERAPSGLPPVATTTVETQNALSKARYCKSCGKEARIVSGSQGIHAFCGPCKLDWPIANSCMHPNTSFTLPRGIHKTVLVPMDVSKLYEE